MSGGTRFARPAGDEHFLNSWSLHPVEGLGGPSPFLAFSPRLGPFESTVECQQKAADLCAFLSRGIPFLLACGVAPYSTIGTVPFFQTVECQQKAANLCLQICGTLAFWMFGGFHAVFGYFQTVGYSLCAAAGSRCGLCSKQCACVCVCVPQNACQQGIIAKRCDERRGARERREERRRA